MSKGQLILAILSALLVGCSSMKAKDSAASGILAADCQPTNISLRDLQSLGFSPAPGKVIVTRIFRIACPTCKEDLVKIGSFFQNGIWAKEKVQLFLLAYKKEGVEDRKTFDHFMREQMNSFGIPLESVQVVYLNKDYFKLVKTRNNQGHLIFEGWKAVPFGMVFGKDGRLAYRGHFTSSTAQEDEHYNFITKIQSENCKPTEVAWLSRRRR